MGRPNIALPIDPNSRQISSIAISRIRSSSSSVNIGSILHHTLRSLCCRMSSVSVYGRKESTYNHASRSAPEQKSPLPLLTIYPNLEQSLALESQPFIYIFRDDLGFIAR